VKRHSILATATLAVVAALGFGARAARPAEKPETLRVLIFSGRNVHNWRETTPALKKIYEDSGRFTVDVTEDPASCNAETFAQYDVLVSNWCAFPNLNERSWGPETEKAFLDFVRGGKGFALFHAASATFHNWPQFQDLIGATWGKGTGHGRYHIFTVTVADQNHPITRSMTDFVTTDELWHRMVTRPTVNVLCTAFSAKDQGGTGQHEPVAIYTKMGKGRCFNLALGHDAKAMQNVGWQTLTLRGTEWAATGKVTIPIPKNWPAAQQPSRPPAAEKKAGAQKEIKAVVVTGGHGFDQGAFLGLFEGYDDIAAVHAPQKDDSEIFEDIAEWPYDVIVLYNMTQRISEKRRKNFLALLDRGVGLVVMHHAIAAFKDWPEYEKIIGAKYYLHPEEKDGVKHPPSTYRHGVAMKIRVEDPDHPITKGLSDFEVKDETYAKWTYHDGNHLLLSTDTTGSDRAIAWARSYCNSRVFYIQLGHGTGTFADRNYRHVVTRAIRWAAMRLPAGSEPKGPP